MPVKSTRFQNRGQVLVLATGLPGGQFGCLLDQPLLQTGHAYPKAHEFRADGWSSVRCVGDGCGLDQHPKKQQNLPDCAPRLMSRRFLQPPEKLNRLGLG